MPDLHVLLLTATPPTLPTEKHPPAYTKVDGRESILRAADLFVGRDGVGSITVVVDAAHAEDVKRRHGSHFAFTGLKLATASGGWFAQIRAGLGKIPEEATHILLHDAARCAVVSAELDQLIVEAVQADVVAMTTPVTSELLEVDGRGGVVGPRPPEAFVQLLTPQVFTRTALEDYLARKAFPSGTSVRLMPSSPLNIRIGSPSDEKRAKAMLGLLPRAVKKGDGPFAEAQW